MNDVPKRPKFRINLRQLKKNRSSVPSLKTPRRWWKLAWNTFRTKKERIKKKSRLQQPRNSCYLPLRVPIKPARRGGAGCKIRVGKLTLLGSEILKTMRFCSTVRTESPQLRSGVQIAALRRFTSSRIRDQLFSHARSPACLTAASGESEKARIAFSRGKHPGNANCPAREDVGVKNGRQDGEGGKTMDNRFEEDEVGFSNRLLAGSPEVTGFSGTQWPRIYQWD